MIELLSKMRSLIMGFAMICVFLCHQPFLKGFIFDLFHKYGYWGVEIFLLLSGIGISNSLKRNSLYKYYYNRIVRLLPACLIVGMLKSILLIFGVGAHAHLNLPLFFVLTSLSLWYIFAIVIYYLIAPFCYKLIFNYSWIALLFISILSLIYVYKIHILTGPYRWLVEMTISHFPVFCLGILLGTHMHYLNKRLLLLSIFSLICGISVVNDFWGITRGIGKGYLYVLVMFAAPIMCYSIAVLGNCLKSSWRQPLSWIGIRTLEIYLIHEYLFMLVKMFSIPLSNSILFFIAIILTIVIADILHRLTRYITSSINIFS